MPLDYETLYPSRFVRSSDLIGKPDQTKTIKKVVLEELGEDKKSKAVVTFSDAKKEWVLPRTCAEALVLMFGRDVEKWLGKRVTLFAQEGAGFGGDGYAVRVRGSPDISKELTASIQRGRKTIRVKVIPTKAGGQAEPDLVPTK
jgi:hypothetical protein